MRIDLVGALTDHYGSPGCLVDYRRQFDWTVWQDGEDPSKFTVALETLAVKAFGDMGPDARTQIIRDRFTAGHANSALGRHLDSMPPETPIRDIVDRSRVWESHADADYRRVIKSTLERAQPVYVVSEPTPEPTPGPTVADITGPSVCLADLETMLRRLLPAVPAQALPHLSASADLETMLKHLLPAVPAQTPLPRSAPTEIETMLKRLLPGTLTQVPRPHPATARSDWAAVVCFSCGNYGHGVSRCPTSDVKFPYMLPGWSAEGQPPGSEIHSAPRTQSVV